MRPSEEFENELLVRLQTKSENKQLVLWDLLAEKLFDLVLRVFESCLGTLSSSEMAARMVKPSRVHRNKLRSLVKKSIYESNDHDFKTEGGAVTADTVWETTAALGVEKCEAAILDAKRDLDEWPNEDLLMG